MDETPSNHDIDLERMSDVDNLMWIVERNPLLRSTITAVTLLESAPDRAAFEAKVDRVTRVVQRLRQRVVANPVSIAPPRWEVDPDFQLDDHVRWIELAEDSSLETVLVLAEDVATKPFDRHSPLWEFTMVVGLGSGEAALITKLHHSIADGMGSIEIMLELFELEPAQLGATAADLPEAPEAHPLGQGDRVKNAIIFEGEKQADLFRQAINAVRSMPDSTLERAKVVAETASSMGRALKPASEPMSPLMSRRSTELSFGTLSYPLSSLKAAGHAAGSKLNAAFLAGIIGGLREYHDHHATPVDALRMGMPISTRTSSDDATSNNFAAARIEVPLDVEDPMELMRLLEELVDRERHEPSLGLTKHAAGMLSRLPKRMTTEFMTNTMKGIDFSASNVPGVPIPVYLTGIPLGGQYPFGPLSGSAVNLTLLSYLDMVYIGINMDAAAIPDADVFQAALGRGFDTVLALAD